MKDGNRLSHRFLIIYNSFLLKIANIGLLICKKAFTITL